MTLQVETHHIPMTDMERLALKEIAGNRLDDATGLLQLSSSQFGSRIENKRHAVSMLERIIESAKTLAAKVEDEAGLERQEAKKNLKVATLIVVYTSSPICST